MNEIFLGIRLKADGSGLVGEVRASKVEIDKLTAAMSQASAAGMQHGRTSDAMTRAMSSATMANRRMVDGMSEAGRQAAAQSVAQERLAGTGLNLSRVMVGVAVAYAALRSAMSMVEDYRAQEQAVAKLDVTIASLGRTTTGLSGKLQMLAAQLQRDGVIGDEAIIEGASFLAMYGKITDELLPRTIRVMADLAAKTGGDVTTAARAMGLAAEGSTDLLRRQGIIISETAKESGDFAQVLAEVERAVGGTNVALGETATGGMTQVKNAVGELTEEVGRLIANISGSSGLNDSTKEGAGRFQSLVAEMNAAIEAGENWLVVIGKMAALEWWRASPATSAIMGVVDAHAAIAEGEQIWRASDRAAAAIRGVRTSVSGIAAPQFMAGGSAAGPPAEASKEAAEALRQYNLQLEQELALQLDNSAAAQARWRTEHGDLRYATELQKQQTIALAEQMDARADATEATKKAAKEEAELIEFVMEASDQAAERQRKEMDEREKSQKDWVETLRKSLLSETELEDERYQNSVALLEQAEREKLDTTMSYAELRRRLEDEHQLALAEIRDKANAEQLRKEEEQAKARAEMMMEPYKNAIRGIQSSFTDFFENVFHGGINSFKDLARAIKDIFLRLAAEIASLLVFRPIVAGILASVGGTALASQLGLTGSLPGGGGFSLPGIPGMGNLFSGAGSFINNIGGMLGFGVPQAASSVALQGGTFFGSAAGGNVAGMAPGAFSGASLTGVLGAAGLGYAGGGMFADILGLNSQNGSIGGALGAGIGMAVGGPIGGLVGGTLGSVLGGLFGNDKDYPFTNAQILVDKNGVARLGRIQGLDGGDQAAARALAEAAVAQFNAMVQAQGYEFDKPFAFYVGSNTDRGKDDQLGTGFYAGSYGGFAGGASTTGLQSADEAVAAAVQYALGKGKANGPGSERDAFRTLIDQLLNPPTQDEQVAAQFDALRDQAKALGFGGRMMGRIDELEETAGKDSRREFRQSLKDALESLTSSFPVLDQLKDQFKALRDQARELGVSVDHVRRLYREQLLDLQQGILQQAGNILDQAYQMLNIEGLTQFRDALSFSALAPGSPIDRFNTARGLLDQAYAGVAAGDTSAAQLFPQLAQEVLTLGRDVYASGPQYAELFMSVNQQLNDAILLQQQNFNELVAIVPDAIRETSQDQIAVLREELGRLHEDLQDVRTELNSARAQARSAAVA